MNNDYGFVKQYFNKKKSNNYPVYKPVLDIVSTDVGSFLEQGVFDEGSFKGLETKILDNVSAHFINNEVDIRKILVNDVNHYESKNLEEDFKEKKEDARNYALSLQKVFFRKENFKSLVPNFYKCDDFLKNKSKDSQQMNEFNSQILPILENYYNGFIVDIKRIQKDNSKIRKEAKSTEWREQSAFYSAVLKYANSFNEYKFLK